VTTPKPAVGRASASGVRRSGDSYQDLLAWAAAMRVIQAGSDVHELEIEINGVGNVDDVVLRRTLRGDSLGQAKWSTTTASNLDEDFLTGQSRNGRSLLQKFFDSYQLVRNPDRQPACKRPQDAIQRLGIDTSGLRQVCYRLWTSCKKIRNAQLRCHHDQIGELRIIEQAPQVFRPAPTQTCSSSCSPRRRTAEVSVPGL
jgi:hypothetical protein